MQCDDWFFEKTAFQKAVSEKLVRSAAHTRYRSSMNSGYDVINLILLVIAVVVFLKLRSVLGRRTGNERPPYDPYSPPEQSADNDPGNIINLPGSRGPVAEPEVLQSRRIPGVEEGSALESALHGLAQADRRFDAAEFLDGAKLAYEMIVTAFAAGDRRALQPLLGADVFESFASALDAREQRGETVEMTFVGLRSAEFENAEILGSDARVTVRFVSEQTSSTKNSENVVIEGDPVTVRDIIDVWTFERSVNSRDPNWQLVATGGN
jgi:predicted lipid-binding transport protein (Tim44 family)